MHARNAALVLFLAMGLTFFVTRYTLLTGANLVLDGDEAIVGLMADRLVTGRQLQVFYYGQNYGLSLVESAVSATFIRFFGFSDRVVKSAMGTLWLVGAFFLAMAAASLRGPRAAAIVAVLALTCPAWGSWALRARGGYITAFVMFAALCWLLAHYATREWNIKVWIGAGLLLALCVLAQPLWFSAAIPLVFIAARQRVSIKAIGTLLISSGIFGALILFLTAKQRKDYWSPPMIKWRPWLSHFDQLWVRMRHSFAGDHVWSRGEPVSIYTDILSILWVFAAVFVVAMGVTRLGKARDSLRWYVILAFAVLGPLCASLVIRTRGFGPRYLLPIVAPTILAIGLAFDQAFDRPRLRHRLGCVFLLLLFVVGGAKAINDQQYLGTYGPSGSQVVGEAVAMDELIDILQLRNVEGVYSMDPCLQWNINWRTRARIPARWLNTQDRCPELPLRVDRALRDGRHVAIVAPISYKKQIERAVPAELWEKRVTTVSGRFIVVDHPSEAILRALRFHLMGRIPACDAVAECAACR